MSKICIAVEVGSGMHEFLPGTQRDVNRLEADMWDVCGQRRGHHRHKDACVEGCGRPGSASSAGGYCCKRCARGEGDHTDKCDERESADSE